MDIMPIFFKTNAQYLFTQRATAKKAKVLYRDVIFTENAAQPLVDCSKEPILDQPNAFDTLLPLLKNVVFELID